MIPRIGKLLTAAQSVRLAMLDASSRARMVRQIVRGMRLGTGAKVIKLRELKCESN